MENTVYDGGLGIGLLIGILILTVAVLGASIFAAVDAGRRPDWAFRSAGTDKALWIALPSGAALLSLICCFCGGIFAIPVAVVLLIPAGFWIFSYRGKVEEAERRGPPYGGYGPPPGYGPPGGYGGPPPGYGGPPPGFGQGPPPGGYGPPPGFGQGPPTDPGSPSY